MDEYGSGGFIQVFRAVVFISVFAPLLRYATVSPPNTRHYDLTISSLCMVLVVDGWSLVLLCCLEPPVRLQLPSRRRQGGW